jgi:hypothetical protein
MAEEATHHHVWRFFYYRYSTVTSCCAASSSDRSFRARHFSVARFKNELRTFDDEQSAAAGSYVPVQQAEPPPFI